MSTSRQRQQAFRSKLRDMNLQPCEIWLDPRTRALLNEVMTRFEGSKQESYSKVKLAALMALENKDDGVTHNVAPQPAVRAEEVTSNTIELWHDEKRCRAKTMRGARCKVSHNLSILRHQQGNRLYAVLACPQHIKRFDLHQSVT